jgi:hypothetical protein
VTLVNLAVIFAALAPAWAATPYKQSPTGKKNLYTPDGVFTGGKASGGTSLLNVRRAFSAKARIERVTLDIGDKDAKPAGKIMGYFQVSLDSKDNRIVVDLTQLKASRVSEAAVQNLFRKSEYVASAGLTLDPEDKAGSLVLNLKRPAKLEVFQILKDREPGKIVLDITPRL